MPEIGEIRRGIDIGYKSHNKHIYIGCEVCGKLRWVTLKKKGPRNHKCPECDKKTRIVSQETREKLRRASSGERQWQWKGGRIKNGYGYVLKRVDCNDPYCIMAYRTNYVLEHRYIMAKQLGRPLTKSEFVHHINGIKDDNRIKNLQLVSRNDHSIYNKLCSKCELRNEIRLLRWQVKELNRALQIKMKLQ